MHIWQITNYAVLALSMTLLAGACTAIQAERVRGSGVLTETTIELDEFKDIEFSTLGRLVIEQGPRNSLTIEAEDNLIDYFEATVSGNTLTIETEPNVTPVPTEEVSMRLTTRQPVGNLTISGLGEVTVDASSGNRLSYELSGAGSLGIGAVETDGLSITISGLGSVHIDGGRVEDLSVEMSGAGNYDGTGLQSENAAVSISGTGSATVRANKSLDVTISGAGNVFYIGRPTIEQNVSGIGQIRPAEGQ